MSWRPAPSVRAALDEATRLWPERSKRSDGTIGDAKHSSRRSDHNPDGAGVVHAFDLTHDPANGVDCSKLLAMICARRDNRLRYAIWNREITYGPHADSVKRGEKQAWSREPYRGANPHTLHLHVSVGYDSRCESDTSPWWVQPQAPPSASSIASSLPVAQLGKRELAEGARGTDVAFVQRFLGVPSDGIFGAQTKRAVVRYQRMRGLTADGVVGPKTWRGMLR